MDNDALQQLLGVWSAKHGWVAAVLSWIATLRIFLKPAASFVTAAITKAMAVVRATPDTADDALLQRVLRSKTYRVAAFLLDWAASVKIPSAECGARSAEQNGSGGAVKLGMMLMLCAALAGGGCATWQDTNGKLLASTAQTADAAMKGWATHVAQGKASQAEEAQVMAAYQKYQAAMRVARDAYVAAYADGDTAGRSSFAAAATVLAARAAELAAVCGEGR